MNAKLKALLLRTPQAIISACIGILVLGRYPYIGLLPFYAVVTMLCIGTSIEMETLTRPAGEHRRIGRLILMMACGTLPPILMALATAGRHSGMRIDFPSVLLFGMLLFALHIGIVIAYIIATESKLRGREVEARRGSGYYIAMLYIGLPAVILMTITTYRMGTVLILYAVVLTALLDTSSYLCGVAFGKKTGILAVSPRKSVAGYVGGGVVTLIGMVALIRIPQLINLSITEAALITCATIAAAIMGDLFESALKRNAHKKDSGTMVFGRGGLLDSVDSHLMAVPLFSALCIWVI